MALFIDIIDVTETEMPSTTKFWIKDLMLYKEDKHDLVNGEWLSDAVITAGQLLLSQQYPWIGGLQPTVLSKKNQFAIQREDFVQF